MINNLAGGNKYSNFLVLLKIFISLTFMTLLIIYLKNILNEHIISNFNYISNVLPDAQPSDKTQDPVRYWPSGVPQTVGVIGSGLAAFHALNKVSNINPRFKVLGALGAMGASASVTAYHSAIENPMGFNRFMFGWTEYLKTGNWPSLDKVQSQVPDKDVNEWVNKTMESKIETRVQEAVEEAIKKSKSNFIDTDLTNFNDKLLDKFFEFVASIFKPVKVEGYLDDLIGQQIIIHIILFVLLISIILLFLFYIINIIFILYKDKIINKFNNNKIITFYIKYHSFFARLSLFYLPIFIIISLFVLAHGLYFLITHQIPYDKLGIDLHTYISNK